MAGGIGWHEVDDKSRICNVDFLKGHIGVGIWIPNLAAVAPYLVSLRSLGDRSDFVRVSLDGEFAELERDGGMYNRVSGFDSVIDGCFQLWFRKGSNDDLSFLADLVSWILRWGCGENATDPVWRIGIAGLVRIDREKSVEVLVVRVPGARSSESPSFHNENPSLLVIEPADLMFELFICFGQIGIEFLSQWPI